MERAGLITHRPIDGDRTAITLVLRQRRGERAPQPVRDLQAALVAHARIYRRGTTTAGATSQTT